MFKNLTYKKKNKLLVLGALLLIAIIYLFGIKKTILAYQNYSQNDEQLTYAANAPTMLMQIEKEILNINSKIGTKKSGEQNNSEKLIELVTHYCKTNNVVLREFPKLESAEQGDLVIETNRFTVAGNFISLLKLVYNLEQQNKLGKIASVNYKTQKDFKTKEMILTATIYLQNIKKR